MKNKIDFQYRVIFFHVQSGSARTRFLYHGENNSVLGFEAIPDLSALIDDDAISEIKISPHPEQIKQYIQQNSAVTLPAYELVSEFRQYIDIPNQLTAVALARFIEIDPPFDYAKQIKAEFRELPFLRSVRSVELELLQKAYQLVLG